MANVKIPVRFWVDREDRGLPMPEVVKIQPRHIIVALEDPALDDLYSDALYYSDIVSMAGDRAYFGLQGSARATVKAIKAGRKAS